MSLIHPFLGWFLFLGLIPVLLHLLLRQKPKKLVFPALRLIQNRKRQNVQRMRLKHIWLMLLRIAVICVLVLAIARPRIPPLNYWPTMGEWITFAAILIAAGIVWLGLSSQWKRQQLPVHQYQHRRTLLRAGLLAGCALLTLLLVLWPLQRRVFAQFKQPQAPVNENVPIASVLVFDSSLSMQYRQSGQTRIDVARERAVEYFRRLPSGSRVAVSDTSSTNPIAFLPDLTVGVSRLGALDIKAASYSLNERIRQALELQKDDRLRTLELDSSAAEAERQDAFIREIIVFTDMSAAAWQQAETTLLKSELARQKEVNLYLIDVSSEKPVNTGLSDIKLSSATINTGGELHVSATVNAVGKESTQATVTLTLPDGTGRPTPRDSRTLTLQDGSGGLAQLSVRGLTGNLVQGALRLQSDDPLEFDNTLYFTVEVQPPSEVLIVSDNIEDSRHWSIALAPPSLQKLGRAKYQCTRMTTTELAERDLGRYAAVCLINVRSLAESNWKRLLDYVQAGGGLFVATGSSLDAVAYDSPTAQALLPGELLGTIPLNPPEFIDLTNKLDHPLLKKFAETESGAAQLTTVEINRIWRVKPHPNASVIAWYTFANRSPALMERVVGRGRTVMMTTSVSSSSGLDPADQWNSLTSRWGYVAFADQTIRYLSRQTQSTFNYLCGDDVIVRLDSERPVQQYLLRKPSGQQLPGDVPPGKTSIVLRAIDQVGQFRLLDAASGSTFQRGFSVNAPPRENDLTPISKVMLDDILGAERYSQARNFEQLEKKGFGGQQIGLEIFPILILLMWLAFLMEHLVANRFYDAEAAPAVS